MKWTTVLNIYRGNDSPKDSMFSVQGFTFKLHWDGSQVVITDLRTGNVVATGAADVYSATATPLQITLPAERPHPIFGVMNVSGSKYVIHTDTIPKNTEWTIIVFSFDEDSVINVNVTPKPYVTE